MKLDVQFGEYTVRLDTFVIRTCGREASHLSKKLSKLGEVDLLPQEEGAFILKLKDVVSGDPKKIWNDLQKQLGDNVEVIPVMVDEDGELKYPVGKIMVRFEGTPNDQELQALCDSQDLELVERNDYVPGQISFRPANAAKQFLPEVVDNIKEASRGGRVWLDTMSKFRRG